MAFQPLGRLRLPFRRNILLPAGRLKPLAGIKQTLLLDDSYNAARRHERGAGSPQGLANRLMLVGALPLWEMAELGPPTEEQHRQLGWRAAEAGVDLLVLVGEKSRDTARGAWRLE